MQVELEPHELVILNDALSMLYREKYAKTKEQIANATAETHVQAILVTKLGSKISRLIPMENNTDAG